MRSPLDTARHTGSAARARAARQHFGTMACGVVLSTDDVGDAPQSILGGLGRNAASELVVVDIETGAKHVTIKG